MSEFLPSQLRGPIPACIVACVLTVPPLCVHPAFSVLDSDHDWQTVENELAEPVYRYPLCAAACGVRLCRICHDAHPGLRDTCPQCGIANPGGVMSLV
jgi:hypothetical protein